jgi:hypothetical protein
MYKLRYHLAKGKNFQKWQLKNTETKQVEYFNTDEFYIIIDNAKLKNQKSTALKIYNGMNKTVCGWIEFNNYILYKNKLNINTRKLSRLYYNPRHLPFWTNYINTGNIKTSNNFDNSVFENIVINNKSIWAFNKR